MQASELRKVRQKTGWTQARMAQALGVAPNYLAMMERGERPIEHRIAQLVDAFARTRIDLSYSDALKKWVVAVTKPGVTFAQREHHLVAAKSDYEEARKIAHSIFEDGGNLGVYIIRQRLHSNA